MTRQLTLYCQENNLPLGAFSFSPFSLSLSHTHKGEIIEKIFYVICMCRHFIINMKWLNSEMLCCWNIGNTKTTRVLQCEKSDFKNRNWLSYSFCPKEKPTGNHCRGNTALKKLAKRKYSKKDQRKRQTAKGMGLDL